MGTLSFAATAALINLVAVFLAKCSATFFTTTTCQFTTFFYTDMQLAFNKFTEELVFTTFAASPECIPETVIAFMNSFKPAF